MGKIGQNSGPHWETGTWTVVARPPRKTSGCCNSRCKLRVCDLIFGERVADLANQTNTQLWTSRSVLREQGTAAFGTGSLRCVASSWERGMWTALGRPGMVSAWSPLSQARPPHNCGRPAASGGNIRPSAAFLTANLRCVASSLGVGWVGV